MRLLILFISFLISQIAEGQIINASPPYRVRASACSYLLDQYSGAAAAYSLRKLDCDYAGSAIRVRESGGNTESDIGFTANGDLDTTTLKAFCGANSGYVTTWYDQANGNDIVQATAGNQPRIVNAGVIERKGDQPAVRFLSASSTYLDGGDILDLSELYMNYFTACDVPNSTGTPFGKSAFANVANRWAFIKDGANLLSLLTDNSNNNRIAQVAYSNTDLSLFEAYINKSSDTNQLVKNGSQIAVNTNAIDDAAGNTSYYFLMGVYGNGSGTGPQAGYYHNGHIGEIIIYRKYWTVSERAAITSNINAYYSIY